MVIIQEFSNSLGNNSIISEHLINQHPNLNQLFNLIVHPMGLIKGGGMLYIKGLHIQTIFFVNSPKHLGVTMKDIKTLMIGFLLATCMFLMMGQGNQSRNLDFEVKDSRYFIYDLSNNKLIDYGLLAELDSKLFLGGAPFEVKDLRFI